MCVLYCLLYVYVFVRPKSDPYDGLTSRVIELYLSDVRIQLLVHRLDDDLISGDTYVCPQLLYLHM